MNADKSPCWDIFCAVIDNFGDIGVTWRLARQLAADYQYPVRLWVDDLQAFARLWPEVAVACPRQQVAGVEIHHWRGEQGLAGIVPGDVVIEAFGCTLPTTYLQQLQDASKKQRRLWVNLEYLSAEEWVADCHLLPSLQPGGLQKFFFFPGFTENTGGVLREACLQAERQAWQASPTHQQAFLAHLGVPGFVGQRYSLFAYELPGLGDWLDALSQGLEPVQLLVPEGRVLVGLGKWLGCPGELSVGDCLQRGALQVVVIPFVRQDDYDRLLWCCDFNAVRGEDSFVRAQWAGRPFIWQIYPQADHAHWDKLEAFYRRYGAALSEPAEAALGRVWHAWNGGEGCLGRAWVQLKPHRNELQTHAVQWANVLGQQQDLAGKLVSFYANWL